uniref:Minor capsid protein P11 C-terminal conserved region domain-containing protein n=1 Tax=viral metagenome TaxID=1070528 RepID=A0A6C0B4F3_9ZZZZ
MLKNISQGASKFFTNERIVVLVIFLILVWGLLAYSGSKSSRVDTFWGSDSTPSSNYSVTGSVLPATPASNSMEQNNVAASSSPVDSAFDMSNEMVTGDSSFATTANPADLLPNDQNSQWSALNPNTMNKGDVLMPDLLQAGYHIGLDTIGQTLRNANLQLRSDPVIPKSQVGPWNQSTIEPDLGRVPLELGLSQ